MAELQAEPWFPHNPLETPIEDHYKTMDRDKFMGNIEYTNRTNFYRAYLWGVEWWYWLKEVQGDDSVWQAAKEVF